jgi:hypothetical protein
MAERIESDVCTVCVESATMAQSEAMIVGTEEETIVATNSRSDAPKTPKPSKDPSEKPPSSDNIWDIVAGVASSGCSEPASVCVPKRPASWPAVQPEKQLIPNTYYKGCYRTSLRAIDLLSDEEYKQYSEENIAGYSQRRPWYIG